MDPKGPEYDATPMRCRACEARETTAAGYRKAGGVTEGLLMAVQRVEDD